MTTNESQAIEVEVVEVDGIARPARVDLAEQARPEQSEPQWRGQIRTFDSRWWPLWVLLGIVAVVVMLTVGVVVAVIFVIFRVLRGIKRALLG